MNFRVSIISNAILQNAHRNTLMATRLESISKNGQIKQNLCIKYMFLCNLGKPTHAFAYYVCFCLNMEGNFHVYVAAHEQIKV